MRTMESTNALIMTNPTTAQLHSWITSPRTVPAAGGCSVSVKTIARIPIPTARAAWCGGQAIGENKYREGGGGHRDYDRRLQHGVLEQQDHKEGDCCKPTLEEVAKAPTSEYSEPEIAKGASEASRRFKLGLAAVHLPLREASTFQSQVRRLTILKYRVPVDHTYQRGQISTNQAICASHVPT